MYHILTHVSRNGTNFFMIQSTKGKRAANAVQVKYGKGFPGDLVRRMRAILTALDAAVVVEDLRFPPGNHLEELKGDRTGQHSVRINGQWGICFVWTPQGAADVEIVDYY
jgi:proteic killer suppression protein